MLIADTGHAAERRLLKHYRLLGAAERKTLQDFAEFLLSRSAKRAELQQGGSVAEDQAASAAPPPEPRPERETVIAAMKRLRRGHPQLDAGVLLNEASLLMSSHLMQGRPAPEVIDDLEALFARYASEGESLAPD